MLLYSGFFIEVSWFVFLFVCLFMAAGKNAISMIVLPLGHI